MCRENETKRFGREREGRKEGRKGGQCHHAFFMWGLGKTSMMGTDCTSEDDDDDACVRVGVSLAISI